MRTKFGYIQVIRNPQNNKQDEGNSTMKDKGILEEEPRKGDPKGVILSFVLFGLIFIKVLEGNLDILPPIYSSALDYSICILIPFIFAFLIERRGIKSLGLRVYRLKESIILGIVLSAINAIGIYSILRLGGAQFSLAPLTAPMILIGLLSYFSPGITEELPFRGYMQTRFQKEYRFYGVILVAILFAIVHLPKVIGLGMSFISGCVEFLAVLICGLAICYVYWKTKSVVSTILFHGTNGFFAGLVLNASTISGTYYQLLSSNVFYHLIELAAAFIILLAAFLLCNVFFKESK
jgi:membrane protease YdiL (CAAX protease family)